MILGVLKLGLRVMELFFYAAVVAPPQLAEMGSLDTYVYDSKALSKPFKIILIYLLNLQVESVYIVMLNLYLTMSVQCHFSLF